MKNLLTIGLLSFSAFAFAEGKPITPQVPTTIDAELVSKATAEAKARAEASAETSAEAYSEGSSLNYTSKRSAPGVGLYAGNSTADCVIAFGAGGSGVGGSGLLTIGLVQKDCLRWVYFQELAVSGETLKAAELVCAGWKNPLRGWLGGKPSCIAVMQNVAHSHHQASLPVVPVVLPEKSLCEEKLQRCEKTFIGK